MGMLLSVTLAWVFVFTVVKAVDLASSGRITTALARRKVVFHLGMISFSTTRFNSSIETIAKRYRGFLIRWFGFGVLLGLIGLFLSVVVLAGNIFSGVFTEFYADAAMPSYDIRNLSSPGSPSMARTDARHHDERRGSLRYMHYFPRRFRSEWLASPEKNIASHGKTSMQSDSAPTNRVLDSEADRPHSLRDPVKQYLMERSGRRLSALHEDTEDMIESDSGKVTTLHGRDHGRNDSPRKSENEMIVGRISVKEGADSVLKLDSSNGADIKPLRVKPVERENETSDAGSDAPNSYLRESKLSGPDGHLSVPESYPQKDRIRSSRDQVSSEKNFEESRGGNMHDLRGTSHYSPSLITPLVPGVTIPLSDIYHIGLAILVSAVVHELGHGLAACVQEARLESVGGFFAVIFPGAYVKIAGVNNLSPFRQLRVYCAGAWHNVILSLTCLLLVRAIPHVLSPIYVRGDGAYVVSVQHESPLSDHIRGGDIIKGFNNFSVMDGGYSFRSAISRLNDADNATGFCITERVYRQRALPSSHCCRLYGDLNNKYHLQCFSMLDDARMEERYTCMEPVAVSSRRSCSVSKDCFGSTKFTGFLHRGAMEVAQKTGSRSLQGLPLEAEKGTHASSGSIENIPIPLESRTALDQHRDQVPSDSFPPAFPERCIKPVLPKRQRLINIRVESAKTGLLSHYLYQGYPRVLEESFSVSSYVPRFWHHVPTCVTIFLAQWDFPNMLERLLQYIASLSLALAVFNMAPVFYLDGEATSGLFLRILLPNLTSFQAEIVSSRLLYFGTALAVTNVLLVLI